MIVKREKYYKKWVRKNDYDRFWVKKEDNTENGLHFGYLELFRFTLVMK